MRACLMSREQELVAVMASALHWEYLTVIGGESLPKTNSPLSTPQDCFPFLAYF